MTDSHSALPTAPQSPPDVASDDVAPAGISADDVPASSWQDDETRATLFLRALFALLAGSFLLWTQRRAPFSPGAEWNRWILLSFIANLLLPLGIVWMFFGQGLSRLDWLRDQKYNAWNYGWDFRAWRCHLRTALILFIVMLPCLWYFAHAPAIREYYRAYFPAATSTPALLWLLASIVIYMFCWEWFFRGFLLFGMAQGFGAIPAIILQALIFGAAHLGKPKEEMIGSFIGGAMLGVLCWREKSFAPAFYAHALIHLAWAALVLYL